MTNLRVVRRISFGAAALLAVVLLGAAAPRAGEKPAANFKFKSEKVTLPMGALKFPAGKWGRVANQRCLICHSRDFIDAQPPLSLATWKAEVVKMGKVYQCPLPPDSTDGLAAFMYHYNNPGAK